jgi:hypothetical protein
LLAKVGARHAVPVQGQLNKGKFWAYACGLFRSSNLPEKQFAALEQRRSDYPKGIRYKPIASHLPVNTLIWECDFESLDKAHQALKFLGTDSDHQVLAEKQAPLFKSIRIEFLEAV